MPDSTSRPRPVVIYGAFTAMLGAFLGFAGLTDLMPKSVIAWVALIGAVITAGGAALVQGLVTPLAAPKDARGVDLKPVDVAEAEKAQAVAEAVAPPSPVIQWSTARPAEPTTRTGLPTTGGNLLPE